MDEKKQDLSKVFAEYKEEILSGKVKIDQNCTTTKAFCRDRGSYMIDV